MKTTLVLATRNKGKVREIRALMHDFDIDVKSVEEFPAAPEAEEDGETFLENALKKARIIAEATGHPALADDSGLEVDALDGAPGVKSARYAGENSDDASNNRKLLKELEGIPPKKRTARFRCAVVVYHPSGAWISAEGTCEGMIAQEPRGDKGFGYDPVFYPKNLDRTMAQIEPEQKNSLSHRARALARLKERFEEFLSGISEKHEAR